MLMLPGYHLTEILAEDGATLAYRGIEQATGAPVIIKTTQADRPLPKELARLRHEYAILTDLASPDHVSSLGLVAHQQRLFLIQPDIGGYSLSAHIKQNPCSLERFFLIALALIDILDRIHRHHIIHKDIKPQNIILNDQTGQVHLIDFGLASRLSREHPHLTPPIVWRAPCRTCRPNRPTV